MIKFWLVVALILPQCRLTKIKQDEEKLKVHNNEYSLSLPEDDLGISLVFRRNRAQVPFALGMSSRDGAVVGVFSRSLPEFEVTGDTACYEVKTTRMKLEGDKQ